MPTFVTGTSAYCTGLQLRQRVDVREMCQLLSDSGVPISQSSFDVDPTILALLKEASGRVEAAALVGERYKIDSSGPNALASIATLGGNMGEYLAGMVARLAFWLVWIRRRNPLFGEKPTADVMMALEDLDRLASGELVFGMAEAMAA